MSSMLGSQSVLSPQGEKRKKAPIEGLMLTSLVDAFSILVIFLLLSFSSSENILMISKDTELPSALQHQELVRNTVIKVEPQALYVGEQKVEPSQLVAALVSLRKKLNESAGGMLEEFAVTIQADKRMKYSQLNQIVSACAQAGFSDLNFAVLSK